MRNEKSILAQLRQLKESDFYPFHMPGHKRNEKLMQELGLWNEGLSPYEVDITEIPEFDDLHEAEGILKKAEELAADVYGAKRTFLQVNGSTGAILAAIGGATKRGDFVLMARNCHKSVYNALELFGLQPLYIRGEVDSYGIYQKVCPIDVEASFLKAQKEGRKIALVILTSPTYEGLVSDIVTISKIVKNFESLLMVDEAHGGHFGLSSSKYFPETAVRLGADIVVQSLHKTLPSFTGTALLHLMTENQDFIQRIKRKIDILETSSPSYLMMASIEACLLAIKKKGKELFLLYENRLKNFYERVRGLQYVRILNQEGIGDRGKIIISLGVGSGSFLYDYFYEECKLVMEMKSKDYILAMTSISDTDLAFDRLLKALFQLDEKIRRLAKEGKFYYTFQIEDDKEEVKFPERKFNPHEALFYTEKYGRFFCTSLKNAEGRISSDHIYFYPPGIPIVVAGELISKNEVETISEGIKAGIQVYGGSDGNGIFVCADGEECNGEG